jgi:hypothetical protein
MKDLKEQDYPSSKQTDVEMSQVREKNFPPNGWVLWVLSMGKKWLGHKADYSAPSTAMIKNEQSHTSTSIYASMVWRGTILPSC